MHEDEINEFMFNKKRKRCPCNHQNRSLFYFTEYNCLRQCLLLVVQSKPFEIFILLTIAVSCIVLSLYIEYPLNDDNKRNTMLDKSEYFFISVFTLEAIMKIIAFGFVLHKNSYLRTVWNCLDFFIVLSGWVGLLLSLLNISGIDFKALRALRALRAMRLVTNVPSLHVVLNAIFMAIKPLGNIFLLAAFLIVLFGVAGLNLFIGQYNYSCYNNVTNDLMSNPQACQAGSNVSGYMCTDLSSLPDGQMWICTVFPPNSSLRFEGPNFGITSFDNFITSFITVFQMITLAGWTDVLYMSNDAVGTEWPWIYCVLLVFLGAYFLLNLILGVLSGEFQKEKSKHDKQRQYRRNRKNSKDEKDYIGYKMWIETGESNYGYNAENNPHGNSDYRLHQSTVQPMELTVLKNKSQTKITLEKMSEISEKAKIQLRLVLKHKVCFIIILILVFLNTIILATEHTNQPVVLDELQNYSNVIFITIFSVEILLRVYAFGPKNYFGKYFNVFDFAVIFISLLECILVFIGVIQPLGLSVLRSGRLLRIFKLTRYWSTLHELVHKMKKALKSILSLLVLLFLTIIIFAFVGMQIFGGNYNFDDMDKPRQNYDDFFQAVMACFQVITGEDWNTEMYMGIVANGGITTAKGMASSLFFIGLIVMGRFILLNVFVAIAVESLKNEDENEKSSQSGDSFQSSSDEEFETPIADGVVTLNGLTVLPPNMKTNIVTMNRVKDKINNNIVQRVRIDIEEQIETLSEHENEEMLTYNEMYEEEEDFNVLSDDEENETVKTKPKFSDFKHLKLKLSKMPKESSLYMFKDTNKFRVWCYNFVTHRLVSNVILSFIIMSTITLALDNPNFPNAPQSMSINIFNIFFLIVFGIELLLNIISYGLILHKGAFLRSGFGWIDLIVVLSGILEYALQSLNNYSLKFLRVLRILRPLRIIRKIAGLRLVVQCVYRALGSISKLLIILFLMEIMFAVVGVTVFKGSFYTCTDISKLTPDACKGYFFSYSFDASQVQTLPRIWSNNLFNYDNFGNAMLTLFVVSTFSGWPGIMFSTIDSVKENYGPIYNNRRTVFFYYLINLIIVAFFMINLFVAFVIVTFQNEEETENNCPDLDKNQRICIGFALRARPNLKHIPNTERRYTMWRFITSDYVENGIVVFIVLNTVVLCCEYDGDNSTYSAVLKYINNSFTAIFLLEAILKIYAFGIRDYFDATMNVFDFLIVIGSLLDIVFSLAARVDIFNSGKIATDVSLFRLFRVLRLVRLLQRIKSIRKLLFTFFKSLRAMPYVLFFIALIMFIFAILGMQLFGGIAINTANSQITSYNNFQTFHYAVLAVFRIVTGDSWHSVMLSVVSPDTALCLDGVNVCNSVVGYIYFPVLVMISIFLIINLFVAVIMDNFDYLTRDKSLLGPEHLEIFVETWTEYDVAACGRIYYMDLFNLLKKIDPPLGFGQFCPQSRVISAILKMHIPLQVDGTVLFNAVLFAMIRKRLEIMLPKENDTKSLSKYNEELRKVIRNYWKTTNLLLLDQVIPPNINDCITVGKFYAASVIYNFLKRTQRRRKIQLENMLPNENKHLPSLMTDKGTHVSEDNMRHNSSRTAFERQPGNENIADEFWMSMKNVFTVTTD